MTPCSTAPWSSKFSPARAWAPRAARRIKPYTVLARYSGSPHFLAVGRRVQGQILAALESWDEAAASFDKAVATLDRLGGRLEGLLETMAARVT